MARKVKCFITKEEGTSDTFVKIGKHYYKDQETYNQWKEKEENRAKCLRLIAKYIGYSDFQKFPTVVTRFLKEYSAYGYDVIYDSLIECQETIEYYFRSKSFDSDYAKCSYMFSIVRNKINDVYKKKLRDKKTQSIQKNIEQPIAETADIAMDHGISIHAAKAKDIGWIDMFGGDDLLS